jgi:hypothetical protein
VRLSIIIFQLGPVTMSVWRLQYEIDEGAHVPYGCSLCILHHGRIKHLIPPPPNGRLRRGWQWRESNRRVSFGALRKGLRRCPYRLGVDFGFLLTLRKWGVGRESASALDYPDLIGLIWGVHVSRTNRTVYDIETVIAGRSSDRDLIRETWTGWIRFKMQSGGKMRCSPA